MSNEEPFGPHEEPFEPHESLVGDVPELAPCPAREALMEQGSFEWNRTRAFKACRICPLRRHAPVDTDKLADELIITMRHARTFITSREKMHPVGVEQYDELLERIRNWKGQDHE